jgi:molybdopterin-guanine dinucleotide biosynthesis protein A
MRNEPAERQAPVGIILAGGRSTRFGADKASALLAGRPLLQWVADALSQVCREIVAVRAQGQRLPDIDCAAAIRVVEDVFDDLGPAAGMVAGLRAIERGVAVAASCDVPLLEPRLLRSLVGSLGTHGAVCGRVEGRLQPLPAVYRVEDCLPVFERRVSAQRLALAGVLDDLQLCVIEEPELREVDPSLLSFRGANTPAELALLEPLLPRPKLDAGVGWPQ